VNVRINRSVTLASYRAISDVVAKGAFFLLTVLAARRLSGAAFGVFALGSTLGWMVGVATDAGLQVQLARRVAQAGRGDAGAVLARWLPVRYATAGIALAVTVVVASAVSGDRETTLAIVLLVASYVITSLVEFLNYFYRGLGRSDIESSLTMMSRLAALGIGAAVLMWRPGVVALALALLTPAVGTLWWSTHVARRLSGERSPARAAAAMAQSPLRRELTNDVLPIGAAVVLSALYFRVDVLLIEWWRGAAEVGAYNAVFRIVDALRLLPAAALAVALPRLCRATTNRDVVRLGVTLAMLSAVAAAVLWPSAGWLIPFCYGPDYSRAVPAFRVLLIAFPLMSLNYALTHQLIGWNRQRAYAVLCAAALGFNVAVNARAIPEWSIVGAAWTTVWTELLLTAGCAALLWGGLPERAASPVDPAMAS
jgi:O-antigen/teichoic acid export membrane protein